MARGCDQLRSLLPFVEQRFADVHPWQVSSNHLVESNSQLGILTTLAFRWLYFLKVELPAGLIEPCLLQKLLGL